MLTSSVVLLAATMLAGCPRSKSRVSEDYVYVTAKQAFLRDRVAAVSNRTGEVNNGDKLKVLDHGRHFIKVETPKGETGWIEEKQVATGQTASDFEKLAADHKADQVVASAVVRDEVFLHLKPGRDTPRFYLLEENDKLQLLRRASVIRVAAVETQSGAQKAIPQALGSNAAKAAIPGTPVVSVLPKSVTAEPAKAPTMEDWWLVRDAKGQSGWMLSRMLDVDAPESLVRYAEGQRIVGAYQLATVHDDGAPGDLKDVPEYVTVSSPYKPGLPYDFDQVRVFIWSPNHHRYETGFREHNIEGFLPIKISQLKDLYAKPNTPNEAVPAFTYKVLAADAPPMQRDAETGAMKPTKLVTKTYRLEGNQLRRVIAPNETTPDEAHPAPEAKKKRR